MKRLREGRAAAVLGALLLLFAALAYGVCLPQQSRIRVLEREIAAQRQAIAGLEAFAERQPDLAAYETQVRRRAALAEAMLPGEADGSSAFLQAAQEAAAQSGAVLLRVKPEPVQREAPCARLPVLLECSGTYEETLAFLRALGARAPLLHLRQMALSAKDGVLRTKFYLEVYVFVEIQEEKGPPGGE